MNGIYTIRNVVNGRVYVGSTEKTTIEERWKQHITNLRGGYHSNKLLQLEWNKYGEDNFVFEVVERGFISRAKETEIILQYAPNCYNTGTPTTLAHKMHSPSSLFKFFIPAHRRDRKEILQRLLDKVLG